MRNAPRPIPATAVLAALLGIVSMTQATVLHVPGDHPTVQAALGAASAGDTVLVAPGLYAEPVAPTPHGPAMLDIASGVVLRSEAGAEATVLDARGEGRTIYFGEVDPSSRLEGFTVTGGVALGSELYEDHGGGIFCFHSSPTISDCRIVGNQAFIGAGMAGDHPSTPRVERCSFEGNLAEGGEGGGLAFLGSSAARIVDCTFLANRAARGGGVQCYVSTPELTSCRLLQNHATEAGGAVHSFLGSPILEGCVLASNSAPAGGAVHGANGSLLEITHCTLAENSSTDPGGAGAISLQGSSAVIANTIVAGSEAGQALGCVDGGSGADLTCSDLFGNAGGDWVGCIADQYAGGNLAQDPFFCDPESGDFSLDEASPCAEGNNPGCGRVGALDVGCQVVGLPDPLSPGDPGTGAPPLLTLSGNPVEGRLRFSVRLTGRTALRILVVDVGGRALAEISRGTYGPGTETFTWDAESALDSPPSRGVYYLCVRSSGGNLVRPFVLLD